MIQTARRPATRRPFVRRTPIAALLALAACAVLVLATAPTARAAVHSSQSPAQTASAPGGSSNSLEAAATKAGETGRKVATSLIALAFAIAAIVLTFKRDFKEAVGVFAVGIVAVLLVSPAGINVLRDTVALLFGNQ
jgi:lysylphosphatidylglycerol synthetase-like protein (DUF2156 family)